MCLLCHAVIFALSALSYLHPPALCAPPQVFSKTFRLGLCKWGKSCYNGSGLDVAPFFAAIGGFVGREIWLWIGKQKTDNQKNRKTQEKEDHPGAPRGVSPPQGTPTARAAAIGNFDRLLTRRLHALTTRPRTQDVGKVWSSPHASRVR